MMYLIKLIQVLADYILVFFAFLLAYIFRLSIFIWLSGKPSFVHSDYPIGDYMLNVGIVWIWVIIMLAYSWRYSIELTEKKVISDLLAPLVWITLFIIIYFYNWELFFSRLIPVYAFLIMMLLFNLNWKVFNLILRKISSKLWRKVLIIWANKVADKLIASLRAYDTVRRVVWILDAYWTKRKEIGWVKVLGKMNIFEQIVNEYWIEEIIQTDNMEQTLNIVNFCENRWISYFMSPTLTWGLYHENLDIYYLGDNPTIYLRQTGLIWWNRVFKSLFDKIIALLISPIFLALVVVQLIRWRKIFACERRVSEWRLFSMYRFCVNKSGDWEDVYASDDFEENSKKDFFQKLQQNSNNITKFDEFLLKSRLIEMAQVINVFKWEMSIVGPRPPFEREYWVYPDFCKKRLSIKSGITGLWQIQRSKKLCSFDDMITIDLNYIRSWSYLLDIKIMLLTILRLYKKQ